VRTPNADMLFKAMKPGRVYRRAELAQFSKAVDRDLKALVTKRLLRQPAAGLYYRPRQSRWGEVPADQRDIVRAFLKTDDFLLTSLDIYNPLGLGMTQLSNVQVVYNRKRVGEFVLDGLKYQFQRPHNYPAKLTKEFLFVDLLNNWNDLLEPPDDLEDRLRRRLHELPVLKLQKASRSFGKVGTQKKIEALIAHAS
jgi:hypothetical protein